MKSGAMTPPKEAENGALNSSSRSSGAERGPQPRIVLVDDDDLFRESLGLNLVDEGYDVTSFSDGTTSLDYFAGGGHADVILLDWRMPGMNGLEVLRQLRRSGNATPVIFLTVLS